MCLKMKEDLEKLKFCLVDFVYVIKKNREHLQFEQIYKIVFQFVLSGLVRMACQAICACRIQALDLLFNIPSEGRLGELLGQASEVTLPKFDLKRLSLISVT